MLDQEPGKVNFLPIYYLAFNGDFLCSLMIVGCVLVGNQLGWTGIITGLLGSAYGLSYMASPTICGRVSDKIGRRKSLSITSIGFTIIAAFFIAFPSNVVLLVSGQIGVGILYGFWWCSVEAFISENSTPGNHQSKVNKFCISWSIGYTIGPFLGPVLGSIDAVYSFTILLVGSIVNMFVIYFLLPASAPREKIPTTTTDDGTNHESSGKNNTGIASIKLASMILVFTIFTYAFTKSFFIGLFPDIAENPPGIINSPQHIGWTGLESGIALLVFGFFRTMAFVVQNRIRNQAIAVRVMLAMLLSISGFLFVITNEFFTSLIFFAIIGILAGLVYTMTLELLLKINKQAKGKIAGFFESSIGIGTFSSPIIGGIVLGASSFTTAFIVFASISTILAFLAFILLLIMVKKQKK